MAQATQQERKLVLTEAGVAEEGTKATKSSSPSASASMT